MRNILFVVPARGGSKRIPRKNAKNFCGRPVLEYPIRAAIESRLFSEVMVSTEDPEIAELGVKFGAEVPFLRSDVNASDTATTAAVLLEVISYSGQTKLSFFSCILSARKTGSLGSVTGITQSASSSSKTL